MLSSIQSPPTLVRQSCQRGLGPRCWVWDAVQPAPGSQSVPGIPTLPHQLIPHRTPAVSRAILPLPPPRPHPLPVRSGPPARPGPAPPRLQRAAAGEGRRRRHVRRCLALSSPRSPAAASPARAPPPPPPPLLASAPPALPCPAAKRCRWGWAPAAGRGRWAGCCRWWRGCWSGCARCSGRRRWSSRWWGCSTRAKPRCSPCWRYAAAGRAVRGPAAGQGRGVGRARLERPPARAGPQPRGFSPATSAGFAAAGMPPPAVGSRGDAVGCGGMRREGRRKAGRAAESMR